MPSSRLPRLLRMETMSSGSDAAFGRIAASARSYSCWAVVGFVEVGIGVTEVVEGLRMLRSAASVAFLVYTAATFDHGAGRWIVEQSQSPAEVVQGVDYARMPRL